MLDAVPEAALPDVPVAVLPAVDEPVVPLMLLEPLAEAPDFGGIEVDVPVLPAMPASLPVPAPLEPVAFCDGTEPADAALLVSVPVGVCATAIFANATSADPNRILCSFVMITPGRYKEINDTLVVTVATKLKAASVIEVTKAAKGKFRLRGRNWSAFCLGSVGRRAFGNRRLRQYFEVILICNAQLLQSLVKFTP